MYRLQQLPALPHKHTCAFFTAPALLLGLPAPLAARLWLAAPLLPEEWPLRLIRRVASSRKESRGPEQNWSSSDKLAAGASSRGRGLRMVEDAMTAAAGSASAVSLLLLLGHWQLVTTLYVCSSQGREEGTQDSRHRVREAQHWQ